LDKKLYFSISNLLLALQSLVEEVFPKLAKIEPNKMAQQSHYFDEITLS